LTPCDLLKKIVDSFLDPGLKTRRHIVSGIWLKRHVAE